jgi:shikimate dehydrogenase
MKSQQLALIGKKLSHSFSQSYFTEKFNEELLNDFEYGLVELDSIEQLPQLFEAYPHLVGFNVTIPYKEAIIPFLDELDPTAKQIGAVNVVKLIATETKRVLKGFNTDYIGFLAILSPYINHFKSTDKALILGTGGSSKSVQYGFKKLGIPYQLVSQISKQEAIIYQHLTPEMVSQYKIIVNTTPLGMFPHIKEKPAIPYTGIQPGTFMIDLIYNPEVTSFLQEGIQRGAIIENGLKMLQVQAEESWKIFK